MFSADASSCDLSSLVVASNTACTSRIVAQLPGIDKVLISTRVNMLLLDDCQADSAWCALRSNLICTEKPELCAAAAWGKQLSSD